MKIFSLRFRIFAFVAGLVSILVVGGCLAVRTAVAHEVGKATSQATDHFLVSLNEKIRLESQHLEVEARLFADRPGTRDVYQADRATIEDHLSEVVSVGKVDWAVLTDANGSVLGQSGRKDNPKTFAIPQTGSALKFIGGRACIVSEAAIKIGDYVQARIFLGRILDNAALTLMMQVNDGHAALLSPQMVVAATDPSLLSNEFDAMAGEFLVHAEHFSWKRTGLSSELQCVTAVSKDSVQAKYRQVYYTLFILLISGLFLGFFGAKYLAEAVSKPLEAIIATSMKIEGGQWPNPIASNRKDEIGTLERAYDSMVLSVRVARERLLNMVDYDPLTELRNYRSFRIELEEALMNEAHQWIGIVDIDDFELFNRRFGSDEGDRVLINIAQILTRSFGEDALISRYSGNEFAMVAGPELELVLHSVKRVISDTLGVSLSIGIAERKEINSRSDLLLMSAQLAVEQAKASGKNRIRIFDGFGVNAVDADLSFLRQSSYAAVRALAEAVDAKDEYTRGHSQRVAEYARDLAVKMQYDPGFVDLVFVTGTLHDVGKIGVPDVALKKEGKLTDEEYAMIKLHPALGEKIVKQIPELADTLPGIRSHHERFDGRGYPDGLVGENIPLVARILALADTYDAMTSDRPYRKGLDKQIAFDTIAAGRGSQFDPELATNFLEMINANSIDNAA